MIRIDLVERATTPAPKLPAWELARLYPREFRVTPGWGDTASITPLGVVGEVEAGGLRWVVASKLPPGCLATLIDVTPTPGGLGDGVPGLPELLAAKLCELLQTDPPARGYAEIADRSASVRGRIDFAELARDTNPFAPLPIVADEFTPDRPRNRAIVAAVDRLLTLPLPAEMRSRLHAARRSYAGVTSRAPTANEWPPLLSSSPGDELLNWARLILIGVHAGGIGYLVRLEPLFERFARDTVRAMLPDSWSATNPHLVIHTDHAAPLNFRPDCVVASPAGPVSVWDAKWKSLKRTGPNPADVQQVLAYARLLGVKSCGLIYPAMRPAIRRYDLRDGAFWVVKLGLGDQRLPRRFRHALLNA